MVASLFVVSLVLLHIKKASIIPHDHHTGISTQDLLDRYLSILRIRKITRSVVRMALLG